MWKMVLILLSIVTAAGAGGCGPGPLRETDWQGVRHVEIGVSAMFGSGTEEPNVGRTMLTHAPVPGLVGMAVRTGALAIPRKKDTAFNESVDALNLNSFLSEAFHRNLQQQMQERCQLPFHLGATARRALRARAATGSASQPAAGGKSKRIDVYLTVYLLGEYRPKMTARLMWMPVEPGDIYLSPREQLRQARMLRCDMAANSRSAWLANGGAWLKQEADKAADKLARQFAKDILPTAMAVGSRTRVRAAMDESISGMGE